MILKLSSFLLHRFYNSVRHGRGKKVGSVTFVSDINTNGHKRSHGIPGELNLHYCSLKNTSLAVDQLLICASHIHRLKF